MTTIKMKMPMIVMMMVMMLMLMMLMKLMMLMMLMTMIMLNDADDQAASMPPSRSTSKAERLTANHGNVVAKSRLAPRAGASFGQP